MKYFYFYMIMLFFWSAPVHAFDPNIAPLESKGPVQLTIPEIQTHIFSNGLKLYFIKNTELPIFELNALIGAGSIHEPMDKVGLMTFMMNGLRIGGTTSMSGEAVDQKMEMMATKLSVEANPETSAIEMATLISHLDDSLDV